MFVITLSLGGRQNRTQKVNVSKDETLLVLRSYILHPTKWYEIIDEIKSQLPELDEKTQRLYRDSSNKQLKDRISKKFRLLMNSNIEDIADDDIRYFPIFFHFNVNTGKFLTLLKDFFNTCRVISG